MCDDELTTNECYLLWRLRLGDDVPSMRPRWVVFVPPAALGLLLCSLLRRKSCDPPLGAVRAAVCWAEDRRAAAGEPWPGALCHLLGLTLRGAWRREEASAWPPLSCILLGLMVQSPSPEWSGGHPMPSMQADSSLIGS